MGVGVGVGVGVVMVASVGVTVAPVLRARDGMVDTDPPLDEPVAAA